MNEQNLGMVEDLPQDYYQRLLTKNTLPLWPALRTVLAHDKPARRTQPVIWRYAEVRPDLIRAGELTPLDQAELPHRGVERQRLRQVGHVQCDAAQGLDPG